MDFPAIKKAVFLLSTVAKVKLLIVKSYNTAFVKQLSVYLKLRAQCNRCIGPLVFEVSYRARLII